MISLIDTFLPRQRAATIQTLGHPAAGVIDWLDPGASQSGTPVNEATALTYSAVWCATRIISETLASLPCILYRKTSDNSRERATDDPRYWLMHDEPHPMISPVTFIETLTAHMVLSGNCYARIVTDQMGMPERLEPRLPDKVEVKVDGDSLTYEVTDPKELIPVNRMLHILGLGGDGLTGWSVVKKASQSIGGAMSGETRANTQNVNNAMPGGAIVHPMRQTKEAREQLRREWNEVHGGSKNAGKIAILHGGMDFKPFSMSNEDMQFLESRHFSINEIARWFRVPLHMLAEMKDSSVRANIEQQAIEFVVYSLGIWITRWQQTLNRKLLRRDERETLYYEFMLEALLRGDIQSRYAAFATARQWGWFSVNDIRRMENMNAVDGGDIYLQPANMIEAGTVPEPAASALQRNVAASVSEIIEQAKELQQSLALGLSSINEAMLVANSHAMDAIGSLREDRELIKADILALRKEQVLGVDLETEKAELHREKLRCQVKKDKAATMKAARSQVSRGESFVTWLDGHYDGDEWGSESKRQLLEACDGNPDEFVSRVQAVLDSWDERIEHARP